MSAWQDRGFAASLAECLRLSEKSPYLIKCEALPRQSLVRQSLTLRKRLGSVGKPEAFRKEDGKAAKHPRILDISKAVGSLNKSADDAGFGNRMAGIGDDF